MSGPARRPARTSRAAVSNTYLPSGATPKKTTPTIASPVGSTVIDGANEKKRPASALIGESGCGRSQPAHALGPVAGLRTTNASSLP